MFAPILIAVVVFVAIISAFYYIQSSIRERSKTEAELRLEQLIRQRQAGKITKKDKKEEEDLRAKLLVPMGPLDKLADKIKKRLFGGKETQLNSWLDRQLMYAGLSSGDKRVTSQDVISYMVVYWTFVAFVIIFLTFAVGANSLLMVTIGTTAMLYPILRLFQLKKRRQREITFELPFFMDDLIANLATGQTNIEEAIYAVVEANLALSQRKRKILPEEFGQAYAEWRYAGRNRNDALRDIGIRLGVPSVSEFVDLLVQGLNTGAEIREILIKQSKSVKDQWRQEMRAFIGAKKSNFMVSVVLIAVGTLILFMVPMITQALQDAGGSGAF